MGNLGTRTTVGSVRGSDFVLVVIDEKVYQISASEFFQDSAYQGLADLTTNPPTPARGYWYFCDETGTYTNFGAQAATKNDRFIYNGTTWDHVAYTNLLEDGYKGIKEPAAAAIADPENSWWIICGSNGTYTYYSNLAANAGDRLVYNTALAAWEKQIGNAGMYTLGQNLAGAGYKGTGFAPGAADGELATFELTEAAAIQLLRLHDPNLVFSGFAKVGDTTPAHVANKAYFAAQSGTIYGIAGVIKGNVIKDNGTSFIREYIYSDTALGSLVFDLPADRNLANVFAPVPFVKDIVIYGANPTKQYSFSSLWNGYNGSTYIDIREVGGVVVALKSVGSILTGYQVIELPQHNASGISAILSIDLTGMVDQTNYKSDTLPFKKSKYVNLLEYSKIKDYVVANTSTPSITEIEAADLFQTPANRLLAGVYNPVSIIKDIKLINADPDKQYYIWNLGNHIWVGGLYQAYVVIGEVGTGAVAVYQPGIDLTDGIHTVVATQYNVSGISAIITLDLTGKTPGTDYGSTTLYLKKETYAPSYDQPYLNSAGALDGTEILRLFKNGVPKKSTTRSIANLAAEETWLNHYKGILDSTPLFKAKLLAGNEDVEILMLGDSFFESMGYITSLAGAVNLPPQMGKNHTTYQLWNWMCKNKPQYDKFGSAVNAFTEVGTWVANGDSTSAPYNIFTTVNNYWWELAKITGQTMLKYSNTVGASVAFSWDLDEYEKLNFIFAKSAGNADLSYTGTNQITVAVTEGNGKIEVWNGSAWVEANGHTFSQTMTQQTYQSGYAWNMIDVKKKFRKATGATGSITVTLTNTGSNSGYMFYWGTERWNGASLFINNIARGGRDCQGLQYHVMNDVVERNPDLVLLELPLTNEYGMYYDQTDVVDLENIEKFLYPSTGDWRAGKDLKTLSTNWTDFEVLLVIPHIGARFIESTDKNRFSSMRKLKTSYQCWQAVKALINSHNDLCYIDIDNVLIQESKKKGWTLYDAFNASGVVTSVDSFVYDNVHPNELGCKLYAKYIGPVFDL